MIFKNGILFYVMFRLMESVAQGYSWLNWSNNLIRHHFNAIYTSKGLTEKGRRALGRFVISDIDLFPPTIELDLFQWTKSIGRFLFWTMELGRCPFLSW